MNVSPLQNKDEMLNASLWWSVYLPNFSSIFSNDKIRHLHK